MRVPDDQGPTLPAGERQAQPDAPARLHPVCTDTAPTGPRSACAAQPAEIELSFAGAAAYNPGR